MASICLGLNELTCDMCSEITQKVFPWDQGLMSMLIPSLNDLYHVVFIS